MITGNLQAIIREVKKTECWYRKYSTYAGPINMQDTVTLKPTRKTIRVELNRGRDMEIIKGIKKVQRYLDDWELVLVAHDEPYPAKDQILDAMFINEKRIRRGA